MNLARKLARALGRDRRLPIGALAHKIAANVRAYLAGARWLAGCDRIGTRARCFGRPRIDNKGSVVIGDDFAVSCALGAALLASGPGGRLDIGNGVSINYGTTITATASVRIGDRAMIGPFCVISDTDVPGALARCDELASPIEIGEDVWLAARVVVRPGARIGAGAVIAAGSVVEGDIPERAVASGSPARVLRIRDGAPPPTSAVRSTSATRGGDTLVANG